MIRRARLVRHLPGGVMAEVLRDYPQGLSVETVAQYCGVSARTARRWKAAGTMPAAYALGLALMVDGDLGALHPAWRGWCLRRDELFTPANWGIRPGELSAVPIHYQRERALERENRELRAALAALPASALPAPPAALAPPAPAQPVPFGGALVCWLTSPESVPA